MRKILAASAVSGLALGLLGQPVSADGTETLGTPSVAIAPSNGVAIGAIGLFVEPASLSVVVPQNAAVKQALLYWETGHRPGDASGDQPDDTLTVNDTEVTGTLIGGPSPFYDDVQTATFRADITSLSLFGPGTTIVSLSGLDSDEVSDGAGVVVLYDQPGVDARVFVRDGNDIAFAEFDPPYDATVPQTITFPASDTDRTATITLMVASVHETLPDQDARPRPATLLLTTGGTTKTIANPFPDDRTLEFDKTVIEITVPAGATSLTAQFVSGGPPLDALPSSLVWVNETVVLTQPAPPPTTVPPTTVPPTTVPPAATTTTPEAPTTAPPEVAGEVIELPRTGSNDAGTMMAYALGSVALGALLLFFGRRADHNGG